MKKYLISGMAAIAFCGAFTSCSHDIDMGSGTVQATVQETYEKAFVTHFGEPASTQTWGFAPSTAAKTRAVNNSIIPGKVWPQKAGTRSTTVNLFGQWNFKIPENFNPTDGQTAEVKAGDVTVGLLTFHGNNGTASVADNSKNDFDHYIVRKAFSYTAYCQLQQAYFIMDGPYKPFLWTDNGTPINMYGSLYDGESASKNGQTNMENYMIQAGHTYRFEYPSDNLQFWGISFANYGEVTIETPEQNNDQTGTDTNTGNTGDTDNTDNTGNTDNTDNTGNTDNTEPISGTTTTVYSNGDVSCTVTDDFTARFEKSYFETIHENMDEFHQTTSNNNFEFVSNGPFDFSVIYSVTSSSDEVGFYYYNPETQTIDDRTEVKFVDDIQQNSNYFRACADYNDDISCGQSGYEIWSWDNGAIKEVKAKVFTIDVPVGYRVGFWIKNKTHDYYPTFYSNQSLNTSDGLYYSAVVNLEDNTFLLGLEDWWSKEWSDNDCNDIIMSVKKGTTPPTIVVPDEEFQEIVVIAEDLTIDDARPDFDFNDAVFKVRHYTAGDRSGKTEVTVLAAGGTLPLYIDDNEIHAKFAEANPNKVITTGTMMNTYNGRHEEYATPTFEVTASGTTIEEIANNIKLQVKKFDQLIDIVAPTGAVPSKIAVKTDFLIYGWCDEREDIDDRFNKDGKPLFKNYVQGNLDDDWYLKIHTSNNQ